MTKLTSTSQVTEERFHFLQGDLNSYRSKARHVCRCEKAAKVKEFQDTFLIAEGPVLKRRKAIIVTKHPVYVY